MKNICVFCGSSQGSAPQFIQTAQKLGKRLAEENYALVYGGAKIGIMGALANAAVEAGGEVIGVMPEMLIKKEVAHQQLTKFISVKSMSERKAILNELSDAFVALPGGFGTLDEIFEMLTAAQLGLHNKACAFLNIENYFHYLFKFIETSVTSGFVQKNHSKWIIKANSTQHLFSELKKYEKMEINKRPNKV
jgi:uncharacterized protein (TIGR00730 family)